jgi:hypothetical protein
MRTTMKLAGVAGALVAALAVAGTALGVSDAAPSNTSLPSIAGSARDGSILRAFHGTWTNKPTGFAYQWVRCDAAGGSCAQITGANSDRYTETTGDVGHRLRVTVTASNGDGSGDATSRSTLTVQASGSAPRNTVGPTVSGTQQEGGTLTANRGTWTATGSAITYTYQWQRCAGTGGSCADIQGATGQTYTLAAADVAHTVRVDVTAKNASGSTLASSAETGLIAPGKTTQGTAIAVAQVALPNRLIIDRVSFTPNPLRSHSSFTARFHVSDTRGFSIQGAMVYALGLPYNYAFGAPEVATDGTGWATITMRPTGNLPLRPGAKLVIFVRARKPGENLLAGVSTRRLVQENVTAP